MDQPMITVCPKCVDGFGPMDGLTLEREGVVSCRYHGEMTFKEVSDCIAELPQGAIDRRLSPPGCSTGRT